MQCRNFTFFEKNRKWAVIAFTLVVITMNCVQGQTAVNTPCTEPGLSPQRGTFPPSTNSISTTWAFNLETSANSSIFEGVTPPGVRGGAFMPPGNNPGASPGIWMNNNMVRLASDFMSAYDLANAEQFNAAPEVTGVPYTAGNRSTLFMYDNAQTAGGEFLAKSGTTVMLSNTMLREQGTPGVAYPDMYIGAAGNAPAGQTYVINAHNLVVNKTTGWDNVTNAAVNNRDIFLKQAELNATGAVNLISGRIHTLDNVSKLVVESGGSLTGGSVDAYVDGPIENRNPGGGVFPVGDRCIYAPLSLTGGTHATVQYDNTNTSAATTGFTPTPAGTYDDLNPPGANDSVEMILTDQVWHIDTDGTGISVTDGIGHTLPPNKTLVLLGKNAAGKWVRLSKTEIGTSVTANLSGFTDIALGVANIQAWPLPIRFVDIQAVRSGNRSVAISWKVAESDDVARFEIERSLSGGTSFIKIGEVSSIRHTDKYSWTDAAAADGFNVYRIKAVEVSGHVYYSMIRSVTFNNTGEGIVLKGNPVRDQVQVWFGKPYGKVQWHLYDMKGRLLNRGEEQVMQAAKNMVLDVSAYAPGAYILGIVDASGKVVFSREILKQ